MAVDVTITSKLTAKESLPAVDAPFATTSSLITHNALNTNHRLTASTTVPATLIVADDFTLSGGALTIDLTSVSHNGQTVDASGLKLQALRIVNPAGNNTMTITPGSSNPYDLFGASSSITLKAGQEALFYFPDNQDDVDGTNKEIDLAGTGTEKLNMIMIFG